VFSIIIIGNEILSGSVADTNLAYMLRRFGESSIPVDEVRVVRDDMDGIIDAIKSLKKRSQFVISTGGIGPTHDDLTLDAYASAFGVNLVESEEMKNRVSRYFGNDLQKGHTSLYTVPANTELVYGDDNRWPVYKLENCFILPGLPQIFEQKFEMILEHLPQLPVLHCLELKVTVSEGFFSDELTAVQNRFPLVEIGSYPLYKGSWLNDGSNVEVAVRITFKSINEGLVKQCFQEMKAIFQSRNWLFKV